MRHLVATALLAMASMAMAASMACSPPPPAEGEGIAPNAAACKKTGQQCRLGEGGALGVCHARPDGTGYACTPQH